jgi:DNA invertase Pin-like site-specific DNA recombinase
MSDYRYLHLVRQDCPLPPGTHVVIYCRDSGGEEQDRSVTQQVEAAEEYCRFHNLVLEHTYKDDAKLSSNTEKRNHLQEMLLDLRRRFKQINDRYRRDKVARERPFGVIFWKSSRLGRDTIEATNIKTDLRLRGLTIVDLVTSANTGNAATDWLIEAFQQWQDEMLLDDISDNARRGLAQLVATRDTDPDFLRYNPGWQSTGGYLGLMPGGVPRGFKGERVQIGVYKRKKGRASNEPHIVQRLVPDPETSQRCYQAWEMRASGASIGEIHKATRLYKNANSYDTFFANRIYTGDLEYGGVLYENFVPALIPKAWFEEEKARREQRGKRLTGTKVETQLEPRRVGNEHLLSGLVFCGEDDSGEHPMHIESIPAKQGKRGNYSFFICTTAKNTRGQGCQLKRLSMRNLEHTIIDILMTHVLTADNLRPIAENLAKALAERSADASARIATLEAELANVRKAMENVLDAIERMGYATQLQQRFDARKREEEQLLRELGSLGALKMQPKKIRKITDGMLEGWIEHMKEALLGGDKAVARRTLQQFVAKIVIKSGKGTLYYTFPFTDELYMSSFGDLDVRGFEPLTSTVRL